jgi:hypothetical protein
MNRLAESAVLCDEAVQRFPCCRACTPARRAHACAASAAAEQGSLREALRLSRAGAGLLPAGGLAGGRAIWPARAPRWSPRSATRRAKAICTATSPMSSGASTSAPCRSSTWYALRLDPGYEWAWGALRSAARSAASRGALALAHEITPRAADTRAWLGLAAVTADETERMHPGARRAARPVGARALAAVQALVDAGRFGDALAALVRHRLGRGAAHRAACPARASKRHAAT